MNVLMINYSIIKYDPRRGSIKGLIYASLASKYLKIDSIYPQYLSREFRMFYILGYYGYDAYSEYPLPFVMGLFSSSLTTPHVVQIIKKISIDYLRKLARETHILPYLLFNHRVKSLSIYIKLAKINLAYDYPEEKNLKEAVLRYPEVTYIFYRLLHAKYMSQSFSSYPRQRSVQQPIKYDMKRFIEAPFKLEDYKSENPTWKWREILSTCYGLEVSKDTDISDKVNFVNEYLNSHTDENLTSAKIILAADVLFYLCIDNSNLTNDDYIMNPSHIKKEYLDIKNKSDKIMTHTHENIPRKFLSRLLKNTLIFLPIYMVLITYWKK